MILLFISFDLFSSDLVAFRSCSNSDKSFIVDLYRAGDNVDLLDYDLITISNNGDYYSFPKASFYRDGDVLKFKFFYFNDTAINLMLNTRNYTNYLEGFYSLPPQFAKKFLLPRSVICQ